MPEYYKIPVLGIQNAGKTSLIKVIQREFKTLSEMKPTKNIERTKLRFLDKEIIIWDFGGQEVYRDKYKKKSSDYFSDVDEAFYVLDIQDQNSFNEAIQYFQEIVDALKENSPNASLNLLLHKTDPGMEKSEDLIKLFKAIGERFTSMMEPLNSRIVQTSIFNPISVITAFSKPLFGNATLYENFSMLFKDFVSNSDVDFVIVFTEKFMEIGHFFSKDVDQEKMKSIAHEIFQAFDNKQLKLSTITLNAGEEVIRISKFKLGKQTFFFTVGYKEAIKDIEHIVLVSDALLEEVKKFMSYF